MSARILRSLRSYQLCGKPISRRLAALLSLRLEGPVECTANLTVQSDITIDNCNVLLTILGCLET